MSLPAFQNSGHFCVHVLAASQQELSNRFASKGTDKFSGLDWSSGEGGVPLLDKYSARFQCKTTYQYEGGDHIIFVGEVVHFDSEDESPLVFHGGQYALAKSHSSMQDAIETVDLASGTFNEQFFLYLLSRAHYQATYALQSELHRAGLSRDEYLVLTLLGMGGPLSFQELHERMEHTGHLPTDAMMQSLQNRSLVAIAMDGAKFALTVKGREIYVSQLVRSKALEEELLSEFAPSEIADMRNFLLRFVKKSDPGVPELWGDGSNS